MAFKKSLLAAAAAFTLAAGGAQADTTLTIATVNNGDMIRMQGLTDAFTAANPDIKLEWVTLEENVLRQRVTQDIAAKGGQFDVMTIGTYEVPIWGARNWLVSLNDLPKSWDADDLLPAIRGGLTGDTIGCSLDFGHRPVGQYSGPQLRHWRPFGACTDLPGIW